MYKTSRHKRLVLLLIVLMVGSLVLSACGDDDEGDAESANFTVGIVNGTAALEDTVTGFIAGLAEEGYTEGENLTVIYAGPIGFERAALDAEIQRLLDAGVDLLATVATPVSLAAQAATSEVPIVFMAITDPVGAGLVSSFRSPGANLTGVAHGGSDALRLEWLTRFDPEITRILAVYNPNDQAPASIVEPLNETAVSLGVNMVFVEAATPDEVRAVAENLPDDIDAIFMMPDAQAIGFLPEFYASAVAAGLPLCSPPAAGDQEYVLFTFGFSPQAVSRQGARQAARILEGTPVGDVPVEQARFFLTVNPAVAEAINLEIPDDVLSQADIILRPESEQ